MLALYFFIPYKIFIISFYFVFVKSIFENAFLEQRIFLEKMSKRHKYERVEMIIKELGNLTQSKDKIDIHL